MKCLRGGGRETASGGFFNRDSQALYEVIHALTTDADGDPVTFTLSSDSPLPTGMLEGDRLVFTPTPDEVNMVGEQYTFTITASDGAPDCLASRHA